MTVMVSDHGETLGEQLDTRGYGYDHGEFLDPVEIALVLGGSGIESGRTTATASIRDLHTTILALAGVGDPEAEADNRRNLLHPTDEPRIVAAERRSLSPDEGRGANRASRRALRQHALAMTDGKRTTLVGTKGAISPVQPGTAVLQAAGRRRWAEMQAAESAASRPAGELDEETRRTLEVLGYGTSGRK